MQKKKKKDLGEKYLQILFLNSFSRHLRTGRAPIGCFIRYRSAESLSTC